MEAIGRFARTVADACAADGASPDVVYTVKLAVEEICLNVLNHGYRGDPGPLKVELTSSEEGFLITITDSAPPFFPGDLPVADTSSGWEEREIGGYGWHLVKAMMDRVEHELTPEGGNCVRLWKSRAA